MAEKLLLSSSNKPKALALVTIQSSVTTNTDPVQLIKKPLYSIAQLNECNGNVLKKSRGSNSCVVDKKLAKEFKKSISSQSRPLRPILPKLATKPSQPIMVKQKTESIKMDLFGELYYQTTATLADHCSSFAFSIPQQPMHHSSFLDNQLFGHFASNFITTPPQLFNSNLENNNVSAFFSTPSTSLMGGELNNKTCNAFLPPPPSTFPTVFSLTSPTFENCNTSVNKASSTKNLFSQTHNSQSSIDSMNTSQFIQQHQSVPTTTTKQKNDPSSFVINQSLKNFLELTAAAPCLAEKAGDCQISNIEQKDLKLIKNNNTSSQLLTLKLSEQPLNGSYALNSIVPSNNKDSCVVSSSTANTTSNVHSTGTGSSFNSTAVSQYGNSDRFSPSSVSCASIDSGFSETAFPPASPEYALLSGKPQQSVIQPAIACKKNAKAVSFKDKLTTPTNSKLSDKKMPQNNNELKKAKEKRIPPKQKRSFNFCEKTVMFCKSQNKQECLMPPKKMAKISLSKPESKSTKIETCVGDLFVNSMKMIIPAKIKNEIEFCGTVQPKTCKLLENASPLKLNAEACKITKITEDKENCYRNNKDGNQVAAAKEKCSSIGIMPQKFLECGCLWAKCELRFATDNELYDHVIQGHLEKLRPQETTKKQSEKVEKVNKHKFDAMSSSSIACQTRSNNKNLSTLAFLKCEWDGCEMCLKRGEKQKQYDWLIQHYTTRHASRAQPFLCLFENCRLRFRMRQSLNDHLRAAHDSVKQNSRKNHGNGVKNNDHHTKSCFDYRPSVQIPTLLEFDIVDRRSMNWIRTQLKFFDQMQKPCLVRCIHKSPLLSSHVTQVSCVNSTSDSVLAKQESRAQARKSRQLSNQFLIEFDKILELKNSDSNFNFVVVEPPKSSAIKKMQTSDTVKLLSNLFKKKKKTCSLSVATSTAPN